jgi:hypothetical protein
MSSNNYQTIIDLTEQLSGQKQWSTQIYITITGDPLRGLFLDRIVWWSDKGDREDGFFWKKASEWKTESGLSYAQVTRLGKELENAGFISLMKTNANGAPTIHYRANMTFILDQIAKQFPILDSVEIQDSSKSNLDNPEIQDSSKSNLDNPEIQDSEISILDNLENRNSTNSKIEIQQCLKSITAKTPAKTTEEVTPGPVCQSVLEICRLKWAFVKRSKDLTKSLSSLLAFLAEEDAKPDEVIDFEKWRKTHHWTGRGDSVPTLKQVGEFWGQYKSWIQAGRPMPTTNGNIVPQSLPKIDMALYQRLREEDKEQIHNAGVA